MKAKIWTAAKITALAMAAAYLCYLAIRAVDYYTNGLVLNWFTWNFTIAYADAGGQYYYLPNWGRLKDLVVLLFVAIVEICLLTVYVVSHIQTKRALRESVTRTSRMIRSYMMQDAEATQIFPQEYAEVAAQMSEVKASMQNHERALKEEVSRKNDLIVYLAHDLKTPLTAVIGYLSLLEEAPDMPAEQKARYVHITLEKALRLEKLINEFFEITRYNLQEIVLEMEHVDLGYMLMQMADEFYPVLQAHGNTVQLEVKEDLTVYADPIKLARVFNNILKNAVAYSYPDTPITIAAREADGGVRIVFENHGKTIPQTKLDMIFEKFFRLDGARATNTGGAGLGLSIAREIVRLHGGTITASSENEKTAFTVTLPVM